MTGKRIVFYILAAFISGTVILSYFQYNFSKNIDTLIKGNKQYLEEYNTSVDLRSLERNIVYVESNISDYVSTGNRHFVMNTNEKFSNVKSTLARLKKIDTDSITANLINQLDTVVTLKLSFCKEVLDSLHHKGKYSAETLINTLEGKQLMDSIYSLDQRIQQARHDLLTRLNNNNISSSRKIQSANIILIVLILLSSAMLFWYIISIIQKLYLSEKKLKNAVAIKENFMANMSHEIRTPMNAILGFTGLLEKEPLSSESKKYIQTIKQSGENLLNIINDILDLSKIEAGMMRIEAIPFSIKKVTLNLYALFEGKANEKNINLSIQTDPQLPEMLTGDSMRLQQVLINLVGNALKFTEKGYVNLHVKNGEVKGNRVNIIFTVEDSGTGIPKEKLPYIFNRFQQGDESINRHYGGTGLGLSIVKELIQLQNGNIQVKSIAGRGTTFIFIIPYEIYTKAAITLPDKGIISSTPSTAKKAKILVAEDNKINQQLLQILFNTRGYDFSMAENGNEVLDMLATNHYDVVLMDLQMPEKDGYSATRQIRENLKLSIPIIAMTAHAFTTEKEKCIKAGMNNYISKPIDPDKLFELINLYLPNTEEQTDASTQNEKPGSFQLINPSYLKEISAGNLAFEKSIAENFLDDFKSLMDALQKSGEQNNIEQMREIAHNLKTTISVMGLGPHLLKFLDNLETKPFTEALFRTNFWELKKNEEQILFEVRAFSSLLKSAPGA